MTDLTDIISKKFLIFLQNSLTKLLEGKVSVVFEDLQSRPISEYPDKRVFARENVCMTMIDCRGNPYGREKCWESDKLGGRMAKDQGKGVLYRCHGGKGFPNFLFPIKIWAEEVVGYLYAGQFVFRKTTKNESDSLLNQLQERYFIPDTKEFYNYTNIRDWKQADFIEELTPYKIDKFYDAVIPYELSVRSDFSLTEFQQLIAKQKKELGIDPDQFRFIIESLEQLANYLSRIGNALYTLKSLVELDRKLPRILKFKRATVLSDLEGFIYSAVVKETEPTSVELIAVEDIAKKSFSLLHDLKEYEDNYLQQLANPFVVSNLSVPCNLHPIILEFYLRNTTYEVQRYVLSRSELEKVPKPMTTLLEKGDDVVLDFSEIVRDVGEDYSELRELCVMILAEIHQNMRWVFPLEKLVHQIAAMCGSIAETERLLSQVGLFDVRPDLYVSELNNMPKGIPSKPFETLVESLGETKDELLTIVSDISKKREVKQHTGILTAYLRDLEPIKETMMKSVLVDSEIEWALEQRKHLDLKSYRIFLNSGGLTPTHLGVSRAQGQWIVERNEEGPVGVALEKILSDKIETARRQIASFISAESSDCIFLNYSTTLAIDFALRSVRFGNGDSILTTDLEHDTVRCVTEYWEDVCGIRCTRVPISQHLHDPSKWPAMVADHVNRNTRLLILSHVTFGTGTIFPLIETIRACRDKHKSLGGKAERLLILVDGAQAAGNIKVNVRSIDCDCYAFDGHKWLMGPEGSGVLYVKEKHTKAHNVAGMKFPLFVSYAASKKVTDLQGKSRYELGTIDAAKFIGFGEAIRIIENIGFSKIQERKKILTARFIKGIEKIHSIQIVNSHDALQTSIVTLQIKQCMQSVEFYRLLVKLLQDRNIVTRYITNPPSLRFCFHFYNSETDVDIAVATLGSIIEGANISRVGQQEVIDELEKRIRKSFSTEQKTRNFGVILFGPSATGKSVVIDKLSQELEKTKVARIVRIPAHKVGTTSRFRTLLNRSINQQPSVVLLDEAERFLSKGMPSVRVFNKAFDEIKDKGDRVFFIAAVNKIEQIDESVRKRRLKPIYFPLPDRKTRLALIKERLCDRPCSSRLVLREMAELTDGFSFQDMISLCEKMSSLAGLNPLSSQHMHDALKGFKVSTPPDEVSKFETWAAELDAVTFTGLEELRKYKE